MKNLTTILFLFWGTLSFAQTIGSFEETIEFNSNNHTLALYVPTDYDDTQEYTLLVALHGCGGNAISFRNDLINMSDSLDAIILCPDFNAAQMSGTDGLIIKYSIDSTINQLNYNINTNRVFMAGYSCNGQETFKQGWNEIYPFAGLIPVNAWVPVVNTDYDFTSKIPTCVCTGDNDPSHSRNIELYDSLIANEGIGKLNILPGIFHQWNFSTRDVEILECYNWMDSIIVYKDSVDNYTSIVSLDDNKYITLRPNPAVNSFVINSLLNQKMSIKLFSNLGELMREEELLKEKEIIIKDFPKGIYIAVITSNGKNIGTQKIIKR